MTSIGMLLEGIKTMRMLTSSLFVLMTVVACGGMDHGNAETAPAAPTALAAAPLAGGAHLTWTDNSDNEEMFMIMRKEMGGANFAQVAMTDFDAVQYHDATGIVSGRTYIYKVTAMNAKGTADSTEVTFAAP